MWRRPILQLGGGGDMAWAFEQMCCVAYGHLLVICRVMLRDASDHGFDLSMSLQTNARYVAYVCKDQVRNPI